MQTHSIESSGEDISNLFMQIALQHKFFVCAPFISSVPTVLSLYAVHNIQCSMFTFIFVELPTKIVVFAFKFNYVNHQWSLYLLHLSESPICLANLRIKAVESAI